MALLDRARLGTAEIAIAAIITTALSSAGVAAQTAMKITLISAWRDRQRRSQQASTRAITQRKSCGSRSTPTAIRPRHYSTSHPTHMV